MGSAFGGAFDHGLDAQRAKRLFQAGIGKTEHDDLALALGYPFLVELAPDDDGDANALITTRICNPIARPVPWPRNLAVKAARVLARRWELVPTTLGADQLTALESDDAWRPGEEVALLDTLEERPPALWAHLFELCFLFEALSGGDATIRAILDTIEAHPDRWLDIASSRRMVVMAMGMMFDRLNAAAAASHRPRMEALLERMMTSKVKSLPLRALDVVLHGGVGYERSVELDEHGRDRTDAFFLDRTEWKQLAMPAQKPQPHMLPTVQWIVQGGIEELKHAGNPAKYQFKGSKKEAHRWIAAQFSRLRAPEAAAYVVKLTAAKSA